MRPSTSLEMRFLASLLRADAGSRAVESRRLLQQPLDWNRVYELAVTHGVTPLFVCALQAEGLVEAVPEAIWQRLQERRKKRLMRSMAQVAALAQIQSVLVEAGIPVIAWKGPTLSMVLYGDYALREPFDLDLLMDTEHLPLATEVLSTLGFVVFDDFGSTQVRRQFERNYAEIRLLRASDRMPLELHDEFLPRLFSRGQSIRRCMERTVWTCMGLTHLRTLGREDLFVSLCVHGSKHGWERLKWACDAAAFIERYREEVNWPAIFAEAANSSAELPLLSAIKLAAELFGVCPPDLCNISPKLDAEAERISHEAIARLLGGETLARSSGKARRDAYSMMSTRTGRAAYFLRNCLMIGPMDMKVLCLPDRLFFLYYPVRFARLTLKAFATLARRPIRHAGSR